MTEAVKDIVEKQMREDNELTTTQLHAAVARTGHNLSTQTVLRCRTDLGWTYRGSAYCQVIRDVNKAKWVEWQELMLAVISQILFSPMSVWRATAAFAAGSCLTTNRG